MFIAGALALTVVERAWPKVDRVGLGSGASRERSCSQKRGKIDEVAAPSASVRPESIVFLSYTFQRSIVDPLRAVATHRAPEECAALAAVVLARRLLVAAEALVALLATAIELAELLLGHRRVEVRGIVVE